jgi:hypothetical protein
MASTAPMHIQGFSSRRYAGVRLACRVVGSGCIAAGLMGRLCWRARGECSTPGCALHGTTNSRPG